jgi:hypothetical protein
MKVIKSVTTDVKHLEGKLSLATEEMRARFQNARPLTVEELSLVVGGTSIGCDNNMSM